MSPRTLGRWIVPLAAAISCASPPSARSPEHLILVTLDTLRADRLGCYGSEDVATPHLDRIAAEGALAEDATVHAPLTRPSHASLFTGLYPPQHGIRDNVSPPLDENIPTLAEHLRNAGFETGAFVSSVVLARQSGLARGFDAYSADFEVGEDDARFLGSIQLPGDETTAAAVDWLRSRGKGRTFLWLHLYDPHDPYEPPEPYASRYRGRPYDGEVAWTDELVGRLDGALAELGMRENALLVVTSDHGESLGEHGETGHGYFVYETTLEVPLLFRGPGISPGTRLEPTIESVDLLPTVLELLGVGRPEEMKLSGRSFAAALRGGEPPAERPAYAETLMPLLRYGWSELRSARRRAWKFIEAPRPELYDVGRDPGEQRNLLEQERDRARALRTFLDELENDETRPAVSARDEVSPELLEKLGALGYLGAGGAPAPPEDRRADPKDKLEEFRLVNALMREALVFLQKKRYAESAERLRVLLGRGNDSFEAHYYLGRALRGLGEHREAAAHFEKALRKDPSFTQAYIELAECRLAEKDLEGAVASLREGQSALPREPRLFDREGEIWFQARRLEQALRAFEKVRELAPEDALVHVRLGELHRDLGRPDRAIELLEKAVALDPAPASYWNSLGMMLGGAGRLSEAEAAFREAMARDDASAMYAYNLGFALLAQGKPETARPLFEKALALDPEFRPARDRLNEMRGASSR